MQTTETIAIFDGNEFVGVATTAAEARADYARWQHRRFESTGMMPRNRMQLRVRRDVHPRWLDAAYWQAIDWQVQR